MGDGQRLRVFQKTQPITVPRGPMMDAAEIASEFYQGKRSSKWVLAKVPGRMKFGHKTVLWYRDDVLAFIESVRAA